MFFLGEMISYCVKNFGDELIKILFDLLSKVLSRRIISLIDASELNFGTAIWQRLNIVLYQNARFV